MKTKFQILLIILCFFSTTVNSQDWYPIDAKWYFNKQELLLFPAHGYDEYTVIKDTLINLKQAKLITVSTKEYNGVSYLKDSVYLYEENSQVYFWDGNQFKLMYDFNLNKGDTLNIEIDMSICDSITPIIVDTVEIININGEILKVQHISYIKYIYSALGYAVTVNDIIIEKIGFERNFIYPPSCSNGDEFAYTGLRCYVDSSITYKNEWWNYFFSEVECDSLINDPIGIFDLKDDNDILIYPNPSQDIFYFSHAENIQSLQIFNVYGQQIKNCVSEDRISLRSHPAGLYIVRLELLNNEVVIKRVVKE